MQSPSLRWYYRNRKAVLARAAERARLPAFKEKRHIYKAEVRRRLVSLGLLRRGPGRPRKDLQEKVLKLNLSPEALQEGGVVCPPV